MSASESTLHYAAHAPRDHTRAATAALILATLLWGCGFTWAKTAGEVVNRLTGVGHGSPLGPVWVLVIRFLAAGILWMIVFPDSRRGWNRGVIARSIILGTLLSSGMIVQHLGLDRTSEAVSAFLTSLTILFVPLIMIVVLRRPPAATIWIGVAVAGAGVWMMTGASTGTFGLGEMLGLLCAVCYSVDIVAVNMLVRPGEVARVTAGQFLVVSAISLITTLFLPAGPASLAPARVIELLSHSQVGINIALMAVFVSMGAFGLQFRFQPYLDPTRAALLYLLEPIFASIYAWIATGRRLDLMGMIGAGMILIANVLVEMLQARKRQRGDVTPDSGPAPAIVD